MQTECTVEELSEATLSVLLTPSRALIFIHFGVLIASLHSLVLLNSRENLRRHRCPVRPPVCTAVVFSLPSDQKA